MPIINDFMGYIINIYPEKCKLFIDNIQNIRYNLVVMRKLFLTMLLAACLVSCELLQELNDLLDIDTTLDPDQFYAVDFKRDKFYKVRAKKLFEGDKCVIWAENDSGVTRKTAEEIANRYDTVIRPKTVDAFSMKNITKNITAGGKTTQYRFDDILDYANWLAGKDNRKLTILLLDIRDNFNPPKNPSFVAGYFYGGNFYKKDDNNNSNGCDMIYVDTYPGLSDKYPDQKQQTYATFAHELQHLINYATTDLKRVHAMDTWVDEGLSSQAEHIYFGKNIETHCTHFNTSGTIAKGNNFFVWDNHPEESIAILDEYSTVYLFFRWLYLQANDDLKSTIFKEIETSNLSDHRIITNVAKEIRPEWANWDALLKSWLAANYNPENSVYGYKNDSYFQTEIKIKPIKTANNKILLAPGEGVYSRINGYFQTPLPIGNIRYEELDKSMSKVLLTYNANTNNSKTTASETGYLTGVSAGVSSASNSRIATEDAQTETYTGPYVIDARDYASLGILGRNK